MKRRAATLLNCALLLIAKVARPKLIALLLLAMAVACTPAAAQDREADAKPDNTSVFPHSDSSRWWVSGQINFVFQAHPNFHSPYSGPNSLHAEGEHATSRVLTLYTGVELNESTEFLFDVESAGGRGLSDALGVAGFTNVDVVRNPTLGSKPYVARAMLHKVFALSQKEEKAERTPLSLLTSVPERRLELRLGKMSTADYFDVNSIGSDSHLQFLNWTAVNNGAYDYAADTRGYTVAGILEYHAPEWSLRFGEALMPKVANGAALDYDVARARSENIELELRPRLAADRKTTVRLLSFVNHANMGSYREAIAAFLNGTDAGPTIEAHRRQGRIKYGFGLNAEQELTSNLRAMMRTGWNEGKNESFAYTEVDQFVQVGGDYKLARLHRPNDKAGVVVMTNGISRLHQQYLALGGNGFLLGDGRLNYGREDIVEGYYTTHLWRGVFFSPDLQWVRHPGYNKDRGPVRVPGLRLHLEL